jgi:hypothetical protein
MKTLQTIIFFLLFVSELSAQDTLLNSKTEHYQIKRKEVTIDYDSLSGLKIIKTTYSFGKNLNVFEGLTPKKIKSIQEVVASNGNS